MYEELTPILEKMSTEDKETVLKIAIVSIGWVDQGLGHGHLAMRVSDADLEILAAIVYKYSEE